MKRRILKLGISVCCTLNLLTGISQYKDSLNSYVSVQVDGYLYDDINFNIQYAKPIKKVNLLLGAYYGIDFFDYKTNSNDLLYKWDDPYFLSVPDSNNNIIGFEKNYLQKGYSTGIRIGLETPFYNVIDDNTYFLYRVEGLIGYNHQQRESYINTYSFDTLKNSISKPDNIGLRNQNNINSQVIHDHRLQIGMLLSLGMAYKISKSLGIKFNMGLQLKYETSISRKEVILNENYKEHFESIHLPFHEFISSFGGGLGLYYKF